MTKPSTNLLKLIKYRQNKIDISQVTTKICCFTNNGHDKTDSKPSSTLSHHTLTGEENL